MMSKKARALQSQGIPAVEWRDEKPFPVNRKFAQSVAIVLSVDHDGAQAAMRRGIIPCDYGPRTRRGSRARQKRPANPEG